MFLKKTFNIQKQILNNTLKQTFKTSNKFLKPTSAAAGGITSEVNPYTIQMYDRWKQNPLSVDAEWDYFFQRYAPSQQTFEQTEIDRDRVVEQTELAMFAYMMIRRYQAKGHELADLDPLNLKQVYGKRKEFGHKESLSSIGESLPQFSQQLLNKPFNLENGSYLNEIAFFLNEKSQWTLKEIQDKLQQIYVKEIGWEYHHIEEPQKRLWLQKNIEDLTLNKVSVDQKKKTLMNLAKNESLNQYFKSKFSTTKRFGIEGCDSLISGLETLVDTSVELGVRDVVIGMPHRGRLNTMACVLGKPLEEIFTEFQDKKSKVVSADGWGGAGDVKYHLGVHQTKQYPGDKTVQMRILPNPSHLEAVNPCVYGTTRAIQDYNQDDKRERAMGILIHGDSAFAGQGVVYESLQFGDLKGYTSGGIVHIIVNNQIGFTTTPAEFRSGFHTTELGKVIEAPIFHVNADHPEQVDQVMKIAMRYRQEFKSDVIVDIIGYRRAGHNELDQPLFTQPMMYKQIQKHPPVMDLYSKKLIDEGIYTDADIRSIMADFTNKYEEAYMTVQSEHFNYVDYEAKSWEIVKTPSTHFGVIKNTSVPVQLLKEIGQAICTIPDHVNSHPTIKRIFKQRLQSIEQGKNIDMATAEALAFASLLKEGFGVRLSGQDVERGTFSQRHSKVWDQETNEAFTPFQNVMSQEQISQKNFVSVNSSLSEFGVLGFEYGYSITNPNTLTIWEAQFGDFANGAQVMIDNFIATGETKWGIQSGLVINLPHGMDGQGAEHSSGRLERFLSLSDDDVTNIDPNRTSKVKRQIRTSNWQICNVTTAVNYFHALRRQMRRDFRKPLVLFNSKKLLRYKPATSDLQSFEKQVRFTTVYGEAEPEKLVAPDQVKLVALCSGQVYYDIIEKREELGLNDVAVIRLEQLSPFPYDFLKEVIYNYSNAQFRWVQEEHRNNGAWEFVEPRIDLLLGELHKEGKTTERQYVGYRGRKVSASPATGSAKIHQIELQNFLKELFTY